MASTDDPSTWRQPVEWVGGMGGPAFRAAANVPVLTEAFDQLVGAGRWVPREALGSFPIRFPHSVEPDDAGWHVEGSYASEHGPGWWTNVFSRERLLLVLFLFSDVAAEDAPTRIRVGSHVDVPAVLAPYGERGAPPHELGPLVDRASADRPVVLATGRLGDVFVCHPFLVHAAQPHHGRRPRLLGQPGLAPVVPVRLDRAEEESSVLETTIRDALAG
ncbi:phytanoyl-CoA dioxygenase family protein [Nocardioides anomalus]|nr:phytanoyl-CoA dioxygenase family protein [Nocardioides anomalus]